MEETGSPGFLMKLHPTLTNKGIFTPTLVGDIKDVMFKYENEDEEQMTANTQKAKVLKQELKAWVQEKHPDTPDNKVYIPKIVLKLGVRKWGHHKTSASTCFNH
eukprot:5237966-Ditylum_brightwellii.AAC.1